MLTDSPFSILTVDAGHTRTKFVICEPQGSSAPKARVCWSPLAETPLPWHEIARSKHFHGTQTAAIVAGSNPRELQRILADWPADWREPRIVEKRSSLPIEIQVDIPEKVGIDRLLNGIAANGMREPQQPAILVDSGTAITIDVVGQDGAFLGGTILPGVRMGARALHEFTQTLPALDLGALKGGEVPAVLGKNTEAAMTSGLYWGHVGAVQELVVRLRQALAETSTAEPLIVLTGGAADLLVHHFPDWLHHPTLSSEGLARVAWLELTSEEPPRVQ